MRSANASEYLWASTAEALSILTNLRSLAFTQHTDGPTPRYKSVCVSYWLDLPKGGTEILRSFNLLPT